MAGDLLLSLTTSGMVLLVISGVKSMNELSAALKRQIEAVKKSFNSFAKELGLVNETRAELAPRVMKAQAAFQTETGNASWLGFYRLLDPTIPTDRDGYRAHPSYKAGEYLRRLSGRSDVGGKGTQSTRGKGVNGLARVIATLLPIVSNQDALWAGIAKEFSLTARQIGNLRTATGQVKPLMVLAGVRPQAIKIIHAEPDSQAAEGTKGAVGKMSKARAA